MGWVFAPPVARLCYNNDSNNNNDNNTDGDSNTDSNRSNNDNNSNSNNSNDTDSDSNTGTFDKRLVFAPPVAGLCDAPACEAAVRSKNGAFI